MLMLNVSTSCALAVVYVNSSSRGENSDVRVSFMMFSIDVYVKTFDRLVSVG